MDAFATPFVQGRLRDEQVSVRVVSECAHCQRPMQVEIDTEMNGRCPESDCNPIIFVPEVNFKTLKDPHIINAF